MKKSPIAILFLTIFIDLLGFGIVLPLLPTYAKTLGASPLIIGLTAGAYSFMQFFFAPIWGGISDEVGRRPIILGSVSTSVVAYLLFANADTVWLLAFSRIVAGIGSANISTTQAYITDITDSSNRSKGLGIIGAAFGLGFVFGPPIGGLIKTLFGIEAVGYMTAALAAINLVLAYFFLPESIKEKKSRVDIKFLRFDKLFAAFQKPGIRLLLAMNFLFMFGFVNMQISIALLVKEHFGFETDAQVGYLLAGVGIISVLMQGVFIGRLTKLFGEKKILVGGSVSMFIGLFFIPFSPSVAVLLVVLVFLAVGNGLNTPTNTALVSLYTPPPEQGETLGLAQSVGSLSRISGLVAGSLLYGLDYHAPYVVAGVAMLFVIMMSLRLLADHAIQPVSVKS
jgi:DHA1 family tetracycline resistance protein-like MFS transporter